MHFSASLTVMALLPLLARHTLVPPLTSLSKFPPGFHRCCYKSITPRQSTPLIAIGTGAALDPNDSHAVNSNKEMQAVHDVEIGVAQSVAITISAGSGTGNPTQTPPDGVGKYCKCIVVRTEMTTGANCSRLDE